MVGCSIRNCKSRSAKGGTIRFFSFPKKESVANEWLRYCGPKTTTKNGRVCSNHFLSTDYFKSLQHVMLNESPRKVRQLKPDALPSLQIDGINKQDTDMTVEVQGSQIIFNYIQGSPSLQIDSINKQDTETVEVQGSSKVVEKSDETITVSVVEHELLKRTAKKFHVLKKNIEKIFTPGQIRCLMKPKKNRVKWSAEDITAAISLRSISPKCYRHLRATVGIPLPAVSTLRKWASKFKKNKIYCQEDIQNSALYLIVPL